MSGEERVRSLVELAVESELDQLIVGDLVRPGDTGRDAGADLFWLTGFGGTSGLGLVGPDERLFITDFRYAERAEREVSGGFERQVATAQLVPALAERLAGRVGYDETKTSVRSLQRLEELAPDGIELVAAAGLVERLRRRKDALEVTAIAEAARLADEVFEWLLARGVTGRAEREVALAASQRMRELGAADPSFPPIVASGPGSALPHHEPGEREVRSGELLLIDMGAIVDGYCSDCTRTFAVGEVDDEQRDVYELVRRAQEDALAAAVAGRSARAADAAARDPIALAGHGERFGHGLGHGVGIEVHEAPRISQRSDDTLAQGDVVTIEPGVYLPGRYGVRIEDLVVIGEIELRNMSSVSKELQVVG